MIIGNGLLAKAFASDYAEASDIAIFASGVSNSHECGEAAFSREKNMLERELAKNRKTVYFSTCSLYDPVLADSPYVKHKRAMEVLVEQSRAYTIFRLPQVVGVTSNLRTLTNFICSKMVANESFDVWRYAYRNLIDVSDVKDIAKILLKGTAADYQTINIACPQSISVIQLVKIFEQVLKREANYRLVDAGASYPIETSHAITAAEHAGIDFDQWYVERLIRKYYERFSISGLFSRENNKLNIARG